MHVKTPKRSPVSAQGNALGKQSQKGLPTPKVFANDVRDVDFPNLANPYRVRLCIPAGNPGRCPGLKLASAFSACSKFLGLLNPEGTAREDLSSLLYSRLFRHNSMDRQFHPLLQLLDQLSDEFVELRDGVRKAIKIADHDPEMALTRIRKVLSYIVNDVYRRRCNEKPGTQPLENLLQRLSKDGHVPRRVSAYANAIRDLGNVGTHTFDEGVSVDDVRQSLSQLLPVVKWYIEVERPDAVTTNNRQRASDSGAGIDRSKRRSSPRNEMYRRYFNALSNELRDKGEKASIGRSWSNFPSGARGIAYNTDFARGDRVRAELYIVNNKDAFNALLAQREVIERELGEPLEWYSPDDVIASRITLYYEGSIEDSDDRLAEIRMWTIDRLLALKRVFGPKLAELGRRRGY